MFKLIKNNFNKSLIDVLYFLKKKGFLDLIPDYFEKKGIKSLYHKQLLNLIIKDRQNKFRKKLINLLFNKEINYSKIKHIFAFPRSGSTLLGGILNSYYEISEKRGNGVPKFINEKDKFYFNNFVYNKVPLNLNLLLEKNIFKFEHYDYNHIYVSHYPVETNEFIKFNKNQKCIFLIRDPNNVCVSWTKLMVNFGHHVSRRKDVNTNELNRKLDKAISDYKKFFKFCIEHQNKKIIKYESFINNKFDYIFEIFRYFEKNVDKKILDLSININENKNVSEISEYSNRYSNFEFSTDQNILIKEKLNKELKMEINHYKIL